MMQSEMKGINESKSSAGAVQRQTLQEVESTKHERDVAKIVVSDDWGIGVRRTRVAEPTHNNRNQSTTKRKTNIPASKQRIKLGGAQKRAAGPSRLADDGALR